MSNVNLTYNVKDKPPFGRTLLFALQQLLAIMAATIAVPAIIGNGMSASAALFGAGAGTLVYLLFTKFRSPVFLGSSFAFLSSMFAAFAGAVSTSIGFIGIIIGAVMAGLVYVIIAIVVKYAGTDWIAKIMPAAVIGPTVAIIGLSLAGNAIKDMLSTGTAISPVFNGDFSAYEMTSTSLICLLCGLTTLLTVIICSVYGKKMFKMIPFVIGILAGYVLASIFTAIGAIFDIEELIIINFAKFKDMQFYPDFAFLVGIEGGFKGITGSYIATLAVAYIPVAFVVFAEHLADHKNISSIIGQDLTKDPGLHRTLLGDGVGSMVGAFFGGCPNTTYGESVACVAISGNASVVTILYTAIMAMLISFIGPFSTFLATIPACVMGGVCVSLYGFIAVSGLKMVQTLDLNDNKNLFVVSVILIAGVGNLSLLFGGKVKLTNIACALIIGIIVNLICNLKGKKEKDAE